MSRGRPWKRGGDRRSSARTVCAWPVYAKGCKITSPWYDPTKPTLMFQWEPKAKRKHIAQEIARCLTVEFQRDTQVREGHLAIKIHALAVHPATEKARAPAIADLEKTLATWRRRVSKCPADYKQRYADLKKILERRLWRLKNKHPQLAPSNMDIVRDLQDLFGIKVSLDVVKKIRFHSKYRSWFDPIALQQSY